MIDTVRQDLRFGARSVFLKSPGFAFVSILTLALGIGANTAIFSVVNSVLLRQLPFPEPDRLVRITSNRIDRSDAPFTIPDFLDYRDQNQSLDQIAAFTTIGLSLSGTETTERLQGARVSANLFQMLGVNAAPGRVFAAADDKPGNRHVVVVTYECWRRRFAGDPALPGRTLNLNSEGYEVVGILPRGFELPIREAEMAIPLAPDADPLRNVRSSTNFLYAVGRLKPGYTREQAEADLTAIVQRQRQAFGELYLKKIGVRLTPLRDVVVGNVQTVLWTLLGAVALVFLIACANLATLSLARASARQRELAVRKALGATSFRLVRQLLTESLILAVTGGVAGALLAFWGVRLLVSLSPTPLPRENEIGLSAGVLVFAAASSILATVIVGIFPAWQAAKSEVTGELKIAGRGAGDGARRNRSRGVLVIAEVALSFMLLITSGLLIRSLMRVQAIEPGFDATDVLSVRVSLPKAKYHDRAALSQFCDRFTAKVREQPGVQALAAVSVLPFSGDRHSVDFTIAGRASSAADRHNSQYRIVTPDYFSTMRIPLLRGRALDAHDEAGNVPVALINENMASRFWPAGDAVGARINIDDNNDGPRPVEIVGVVGNVKHLSLESAPTFDIYLPVEQVHEDGVGLITNTLYWVVRSGLDAHEVENTFRQALRDVDREAATSNITTLENYVSNSIGPRKFSLRVLTIFSVAALLLAATGIYGLASYTVSRRTQEIGIRMALGAKKIKIFQMVVGQGLKSVLIGLVLGAIGALGLARVIRSLLFGVAPTDVFTFVGVSLIMIVLALMACGLPAQRATSIDPLIALRRE
jgi:predicted permease